MSCSEEVRYHECGHAVCAIKLKIGLEPEGIRCRTDEDACTHVRHLPPEQWSQQYCVDRAAVKLAGPAAECILRCQAYDPDILLAEHHYLADYNKAQQILQAFQSQSGKYDPSWLDHQLCEALVTAYNTVSTNWESVARLAGILDGKDRMTEQEINNVLNAVG